MNADARKQREIEERERHGIEFGSRFRQHVSTLTQKIKESGARLLDDKYTCNPWTSPRPYLIDSDGVPPTAEEREKLGR